MIGDLARRMVSIAARMPPPVQRSDTGSATRRVFHLSPGVWMRIALFWMPPRQNSTDI
jgi:hypothetical protein